MHTLLNGHNSRLWSPATTMTHFFLCQCTFHVLVIRELNYLIGNDVLFRALPLLNNLEFGIVLQTADELIARLIKLLPFEVVRIAHVKGDERPIWQVENPIH